MTGKYRIAINRMALPHKLPPGDRRWAEFNDGFEDLALDPMEIVNAIYMGRAYTSWMGGRRRNNDNFVSSQWIGIDLDTEDGRSRLSTLIRNPWVANYASIVHSTPSSTREKPRSRVLFLLDQPINDAQRYMAASNFLMSQFPGADSVCKDAARFYYGALNCDVELPLNELPLRILRDKYAQWRDAHPDTAPVQHQNVSAPLREYREQRREREQGNDSERSTRGYTLDQDINKALTDATPGNRNVACFWLAKRLVERGLSVIEQEGVIRDFAHRVPQGSDPFTEAEAMSCLKSAQRAA